MLRAALIIITDSYVVYDEADPKKTRTEAVWRYIRLVASADVEPCDELPCVDTFSVLPKEQRVVPVCPQTLPIISEKECVIAAEIAPLLHAGTWGSRPRMAGNNRQQEVRPPRLRLAWQEDRQHRQTTAGAGG